MALHLPTLLLASVLTMAMSGALMTLFGLTQRVYRGFWWWTTAQWLGTLGMLLQVFRESHPGVLPLANLLLLQWPIVTLVGVRRFFPRQLLRVPVVADGLVFILAYLGWVATWAAGGSVAARIVAFGSGACLLHAYSAALTLRLQAFHRSAALKALVAVQCTAAVAQALRAGQAMQHDIPWLTSDEVLFVSGLASAMLAMVTVYLSLLLTHERTALKLTESQRRLRTLAYTDMLTEVPNRRHFFEIATKVLALGMPGRTAVVLFDLDRFKDLNDRFGHAEGDEALREVARAAGDTLRTGDFAGRIGGDEFAMLLPETVVTEALAVADRISTRLNSLRAFRHGVPPLSLSFGIVMAREGENIADALHRADQALYEAKRQGRRRAVVASGGAGDPVYGESRPMGLPSH